MKKLLIILLVFISTIGKSQDSTAVTLSVQARDLEVFGSFIFLDNSHELLYDTIKLKFRIVNPPTSNDAVSITGYTLDWIRLYRLAIHNNICVNANATSRLRTLLNAVGQSYLNTQLGIVDTEIVNLIQAQRQFGRTKLRKQ